MKRLGMNRRKWFRPTSPPRGGDYSRCRFARWPDMLMRGSHDCPMHRNPFTLMRIQVTTTEGISIWKPMWLIMMGQRRHELTTTEGYQAYRQRYDIEHLLRFGKQRLLLNASATPSVEHEENWVQLSFLAYVQLWAARKLASTLPQPWELIYLKKLRGFLVPVWYREI